jgi:hypothetical protein
MRLKQHKSPFKWRHFEPPLTLCASDGIAATSFLIAASALSDRCLNEKLSKNFHASN